MKVRDGVERIKIRFKKFTGQLKKEEEKKIQEGKLEELEMVYERIRRIPFTEWSLIINVPNPILGRIRERYEANMKLPLYSFFDDGRSKEFLKEYEYSLHANTENIGVVFQADDLSRLTHICGLLHYRLGDAELKREYIELTSKVSLLEKGFADFIKSGQDVFVRDNIQSRIIEFFDELSGKLVPMKQSDFRVGQRSLPLSMQKSILRTA